MSSQNVWVLSVDLQAKSATFTSGLAEAAKSARGAFTDIKSGASEMGGGVAESSIDIRHSLGLVDNVIRGAHAQAMADLVRMYAQSALVMATLPIAATVAGLALVGGVAYSVYERVRQLKEEQEKLSDDMTKFGTAGNLAFRAIDDRILSAEQKADELRNDHLGALSKQLELIDHASMDDLIHSLESVMKESDTVFKDLEGHWYTFGIGSAGASHALKEFQTQYSSLLAQGRGSEASDLLKGTRESAEKVLAMQKQAASVSGGATNALMGSSDTAAAAQARNELKKAGVGYTEKEVAAQQQLVDALSQQATMEAKVAQLKGLESGNAGRSTAGAMSGQAAAAARAAVESQLRMGEMAVAADRATANSRLTISRASVEERLASDLSFAQRELDVQLASNQAQIGALDKLAKDYPTQLKALHEKAQELTQQHETTVTELTAKAATDRAARDLQAIEQGERASIEATQQGSAARLAAINAALAQEESRHLQDTAFYRDLETQKVQTIRQAADEEAKLKADAAREAADSTQKMGELALAAEREKQQLTDSARRMSVQQRIAEETAAANQEYALKLTGLSQEIAALDKGGKDYNTKLQELQNKQKQLIQAHENEITAIKDKAAITQNQHQQAALTQLESMTASGLTQVIMGHRSFGAAMSSIGDQVVSGMLRNALMSMMTLDMTKEREAAAAARKMWLAGASFPFPTNIVMAPVLAAGAFASMMAFEKGTDSVPGVGRGDVVPAMLTPGEGIVPGGVMDGLRGLVQSGGLQGGNHYHAHIRPVYNIQALDSSGIDAVLAKNTDAITKHTNNTLRKMNKR